MARYGKQPLSEILRLTYGDLREFEAALVRLVDRENTPAK